MLFFKEEVKTENQRYEDEINLRDYIKVIIKRKWVILIVFFLCVVTTAIVNFLMPKVYRTQSKVNIFQARSISLSQYLPKYVGFYPGKEEIKEMLASRNLLDKIIKELNLKISPVKFKDSIDIKNIKNTGLIEIDVRYTNPDIALSINKRMLDYIISFGHDFNQKLMVPINRRIEELGKEIKNVEVQAEKTQSFINSIYHSGHVTSENVNLELISLQNVMSNYETRLSDLRDKKNNLELLRMQFCDFRVVENPVRPEYPVAPKFKLNIVISAILGVFAGIFFAFFQEYWEKLKETF